MKLVAYVDGSCRGNPGPGGWGVWLQGEGVDKRLNDAFANTTNNQMELTAAIKALEAIGKSDDLVIYTDSKYVMDGIKTWIHNWKKRQWKTSSGQAVKNQTLWQQLDNLNSTRRVEWRWVKGHSGNEGNEMADTLANLAVDRLMQRGAKS